MSGLDPARSGDGRRCAGRAGVGKDHGLGTDRGTRRQWSARKILGVVLLNKSLSQLTLRVLRGQMAGNRWLLPAGRGRQRVGQVYGYRLGEGACIGLSMLWLESMMSRPNSSPINKHGSLTTNTGLQGAFARQQRYEEKHAEALGASARLSPEAAAQQAAEALFAERGLSVTAKVSGSLDEEHLASLIAKPGHYIIALTGFNDAHCLAVTTQNSHEQTPRITGFDPEAGEFKMHEHEAEYFLTALNARYKTVCWNYSGMDVFSLKPNTSGAGAGSARVQTLRQAQYAQSLSHRG